MRHDHDATLPDLERINERVDRVSIQMVCGLITQQLQTGTSSKRGQM